jgi:DNA-directed RNA polymerase specialized sigma24 family protein
MGDELRVPDLDPEARAILSCRARRAAAALDSLPEGTRHALLLVADEGMSAAEAAGVLGIREEALRARLCRGRRRIAETLEGDQ